MDSGLRRNDDSLQFVGWNAFPAAQWIPAAGIAIPAWRWREVGELVGPRALRASKISGV